MEAIDLAPALERRSKVRYPVIMNLRYRTVSLYRQLCGLGHSVNMSSGGILVAAERGMPVGRLLELNIMWPALLDGAVPLQLVVVGRVVRSLERGFALKFTQCQFRTMSRYVQSTSEDEPGSHEPTKTRPPDEGP